MTVISLQCHFHCTAWKRRPRGYAQLIYVLVVVVVVVVVADAVLVRVDAAVVHESMVG